MKILPNLTLVIVIIVLTACSPKGSATLDPSKTQGQLLKFASEEYNNLAIFGNRLVAFAERNRLIKLSGNLVRNETTYYYAYEGEEEAHLLDLFRAEKCQSARYSNFKSLPDGRLGMEEDCFGSISNDFSFLLAYDWVDQSLDQIVDGTRQFRLAPSDFVWNSDMTLGIQETQGKTINWITPSGISAMDIEIEDQGITWNLKEYYYDNSICTGLVYRPSWSPNGKIIAFFASGEAKKKNCASRTIFRTNMYFMDSANSKPNLVLSKVYDPYSPAWSPDSKKIAFWGCSNPHSRCKIWIFSHETKELQFIDIDNYIRDIAWITGTEIVLIKCVDAENDVICGKTEIWKYDLSP